ncbi:MAG: hypothetical protein P8P89_00170, partial [Paracoccaceae bacterium]|nr:hypothetical protein [Paracoccaceae bacterium]
INSNLAASGGKGKNQKPIAARTKATASSRVKKIRTAEKLPPLLLKYGGKLTTPKIFFCIIAAPLSLMGIITTRLRQNCDIGMKRLGQPEKYCKNFRLLSSACVTSKFV